MYSVKIVKGGVARLLPECHAVQATDRQGSGVALELIPGGQVVSLPEDGDAIYVISCETGVTVDIHRYPPRPRPYAAAPQQREA